MRILFNLSLFSFEPDEEGGRLGGARVLRQRGSEQRAGLPATGSAPWARQVE